MDSQNKVLMTMTVFTDCTLSCFVHSSGLIPSRENEEILIVDCKGVAHKAYMNICPENVKTVDIREFMNIFDKINRIRNEAPILNEIAGK